MAENRSGFIGAGSGINVASERGKRDRDLELAVEATTATASDGAPAGEDLQVLTNAMVGAEVAKKPLWVKTKDPVHLGGEGKFPLEKQPYHMVPAVGKAFLSLVRLYGWKDNGESKAFVVFLGVCMARKLIVLCDSSLEPCTVASFNALPKVMPPMKYAAYLGNAKTLVKELKESIAAQPHGNEVDGDGRLVMKNRWRGDTDLMAMLIVFLHDGVSSHHTDVVHQILRHVKLTSRQANDCFRLAMVRPKDFKATTKRPDPPVTTMQKEVLMGLVDPEQQLDIAIEKHHVEFVRKFGTKDAINRRLLLYTAVFYQNERMVKVLLEKGVDVDARKKSGMTALHHAAIYQNECIVKLLLEKGADVHALDNDGKTALHGAVIFQSVRMVKVLIEKGADVHVRDNNGNTALMLAKDGTNPNHEIIALLTEAGRNRRKLKS